MRSDCISRKPLREKLAATNPLTDNIWTQVCGSCILLQEHSNWGVILYRKWEYLKKSSREPYYFGDWAVVLKPIDETLKNITDEEKHCKIHYRFQHSHPKIYIRKWREIRGKFFWNVPNNSEREKERSMRRTIFHLLKYVNWDAPTWCSYRFTLSRSPHLELSMTFFHRNTLNM